MDSLMPLESLNDTRTKNIEIENLLKLDEGYKY